MNNSSGTEPPAGAVAAEPPLRPWDVHNRTLYGNVHPPDWVNPEPAPRYNLVVMGGGTAGLVTAAPAVIFARPTSSRTPPISWPAS